mmetsp:Transcript_57845/g.164347  ORF Transcript_57845/g.164347 Transcript_57845/m.164347 type:complete len:208 (-) Transcript_57845:1174-1797(-)
MLAAAAAREEHRLLELFKARARRDAWVPLRVAVDAHTLCPDDVRVAEGSRVGHAAAGLPRGSRRRGRGGWHGRRAGHRTARDVLLVEQALELLERRRRGDAWIPARVGPEAGLHGPQHGPVALLALHGRVARVEAAGQRAVGLPPRVERRLGFFEAGVAALRERLLDRRVARLPRRGRAALVQRHGRVALPGPAGLAHEHVHAVRQA